MYRLIKRVFVALLSFSGSLASIANVSNFTPCISINNEPCTTRSTLIDINLDEYNQELRCYSFIVNLDICNGSCNTLDELSGRIYVLSKTEDVNLSVFNTIANVNQ